MLSPTQRAVLEPLRQGRPVPVDRLVNHIYGGRHDGGPDNAAETIRQQIYYMRQKLAQHGIEIRTIGQGRGSHGYMVPPEQASALDAYLANSFM